MRCEPAQIFIRKGGQIVQVVPPINGPGAQPTDSAVQAPKELVSAVELPIDNERRKMIEAAQDYIHEEKWDTATRTLQKLLMYPEDKMVEIVSQGRTTRRPSSPSAPQRGQGLVGTLPPRGMEFYKATYGADAVEMLNKAKESGRRDDLALVMMYYFHTDAGGGHPPAGHALAGSRRLHSRQHVLRTTPERESRG